MQESEIERVIERVLAAQRRKEEESGDQVILSTVATILKSFGIDEDERLEIKLDFAHLRRWRKSVEQIEKASWRAVVMALVTGFIGMVLLGIQTKFGK